MSSDKGTLSPSKGFWIVAILGEYSIGFILERSWKNVSLEDLEEFSIKKQARG